MDAREGHADMNEPVIGNINNYTVGFTTVMHSRNEGNRWVARDTSMHDNQVGNKYAVFGKFASSDHIEKFFPEDVDSVIRVKYKEEQHTKEEEWE